ncbi:MAG: PLP-dependent aminotransferase family protein [Solirubrobacterales bacterium]
MADEIISFARGAPSADIVPAEALRRAAAQVLADDPAGALSYGPGTGYGPLRDWVAKRHDVEPERVMLANGSLEGGMMLFDLLIEPGDTVVVESPSYDRTLKGLRSRGAELLAIPLADDGLDVGALERALESGARPSFIHTIPNFHNPAGCTMSLAKRDRLLELAAEYDFLVFEDDPYREVRFEGEDLPTMLSRDSAGRVIYACSFSKTIAPGVRTGYMIGPADTIDALRAHAVDTYISPNMLAEAIVGEFCRSGAIETSIADVKVALRARRDAVAQALGKHFGSDARFVTPEGGYFLWVELPEGVDTGQLLEACKQRGVTFVKGSDFMLEGGTNCMRLAFSAVTPEQASEGVERIAQALAAPTAAA